MAPDRFGEFLQACRDIIPKSRLEFLNVTLRYVKRDDTALLAYAKTDRIAAVMSFSQRMNGADEEEMIRVTEALIERMGEIGGSFYLPYRLHARRDQVHKIYPNAARFVALKRSMIRAFSSGTRCGTPISRIEAGNHGQRPQARVRLHGRARHRRGDQLHSGAHGQPGQGLRYLRARHLRRPAAPRLGGLGRRRGLVVAPCGGKPSSAPSGHFISPTA